MKFINDYLALAFQIDRRFEGFVDSWFCDPSIREAALRSDASSEDLLASAERLAEQIDHADCEEDRKEYLRKQIQGMVTTCRMLADESLSYREEVEGCFDIVPERIPEQQFDDAIAVLDNVLPGRGAIRDRMKHWRDQYVVSTEIARRSIDIILEEAQRRTTEIVALPGNEGVEVVFVDDLPWSGYNWYLGDTRSRVALNTDLPIHANELVGLIAHEAYPGHHTEHCLKDALLYQQQGYDEMAVQLINTPECVVHEGIAMMAETMIFPDDEVSLWKQEELYPQVGIEADTEVESAVVEASTQLRGVGGNAALMRHEDGAARDVVIDYLATYSLRSTDEAAHRLSFIDDPLWRPYIFTYHVGRDLLRQWIGSFPAEQRQEQFRWLLTSQTTPTTLRAKVGTPT